MASVRSRILPALVVLILGSVLARTEAFARDTDKSWEYGVYLLGSRYAGVSDIDKGFGFGVRGGYHIKATNEIEGSFDRLSANNSSVSSISYDVTKLSADVLRVYLIKGHDKMTPFASFGLGIIRVDKGSDSTDSTAIRAGGGFKYFIKPRAGFRFDVKVYRWHGDGNVLPGDAFFSMDVTFGATFLVGGAK